MTEDAEKQEKDDLCQDAPHTAMHHYPEIFDRALAATQGPVLSFGCSTGEEVRSLKALTRRPVHGLEACSERLRACRVADPSGVYFKVPEQLDAGTYGLAFAMSVLCRYPGAPEDFTFDQFGSWMERLDVLLRPGALLILWNANYDFRDTATCKERYEAVPFVLVHGGQGFDSECPAGDPGSGFLPKFSSTHEALGELASRAVPLAFKKRCTTDWAPQETACASRGSA